MRDFQFPGRSPVRATRAMAATSHPLSTLAAIEMLRGGGNAIDAAISAAAVQAVVEPQSTGIGGDCFVLFCPAGSDRAVALNGSGRAPRKASLDWYRDRGFDNLPTYGPHAVSIPGAVDAWCRLLADHGRRSLAEVLEPAIYYAEQGYVVHDRVAHDWKKAQARLAQDPHAAEILLSERAAFEAGNLHRQPALARTLRLVAAGGRAVFYEGAVAEAIAARLQELGGLHETADFAATAADYVTPLTTDYGGHRIHQIPPNNQGLTALSMLNILSAFDLRRLDPLGAARMHLEVEAGRLAYRDRDDHLGELAEGSPMVRELLSAARAGTLAKAIDPARAMTDLPAPALAQSDTVYLCVVDEERNAVSCINSLYHSFGSAVICPETGVILQNRGASFRLDPAHPNALAPGKRPLHTIMPGMATRGGRAVMPFGVMGGDYQPFGHVHLLTNLLDFGMDVQEALDCPRVFYRDGRLEAERSLPQTAAAGLRERGHEVIEAPEAHGGGQAIWIDWEQGTLTGGSDPRKDGMAIGY
ncbi:MAG: gamma-glutamyltransferase family protein [Rhodospirillales bacterium]|nr:gamma-glutamyltransferase family protein [Rhodospirillales bacterium]